MFYNPIKNVFCAVNRRVGPADGSPGLTTVTLSDEGRTVTTGGIRSHYAGRLSLKAGRDRCVNVGSLSIYGAVVEFAPTSSRTVCGRPPLL